MIPNIFARDSSERATGVWEWTYGMALAKRVDVEKGERLVALKELEAGNLALDDFAEDA